MDGKGHDEGTATARKPRADAKRNRDRLLDVAKSAFAETGSDVSLEEIAKRAGVGIGTLYRHFPTRDAMVEAVYRHDVEQLAAAAARLAGTREPVEALRDWMRLFVDHVATKKLIAPALNSLVGGPSGLYESSGAQVKTAIAMLVNGAVASGDIRLDFEPLDLLRALVGVANISTGPDWEASARRLVDILVDGAQVSRKRG